MEIKTKYDIGKWVWFMHENSVHQGVIKGILVNIEEKRIIEKYSVRDINDDTGRLFEIGYIFPTKEELLKSL